MQKPTKLSCLCKSLSENPTKVSLQVDPFISKTPQKFQTPKAPTWKPIQIFISNGPHSIQQKNPMKFISNTSLGENPQNVSFQSLLIENPKIKI